MPPSPMNAGMRCSSFGGCRADCIPSYQFPNGKTQVMIECVDSKWQVRDEPSWNPVPSCQRRFPTRKFSKKLFQLYFTAICLPECLNNGICVSPNQCQCAENFSGPQCQYENKPCLQFSDLPKNSKRSCRSK